MSVGKITDAVISNSLLGVYDFSIDNDGDIKTDDFFDTAILMSLFCERRASPSEMPASHLRRGWIGNEFTPSFEIGSKLWLFEQERLTRNTLNGIESAAKNGLQWMVDDDIAVNINTSASLQRPSGIVLVAIITRPNSKVERRYFDLWENTGR